MMWAQLAVVAALILLNAAFAGSEIALISLRERQIARLAERGPSGQALVRLAADPNRFLATIQIGITLAGFLASATAAVTLSEPLVAHLEPLGAAARPVAIVAVTAVLTFLTLVAGELAPKRMAMQRAERWSLIVARPLNALAAAARPAVWLLGLATDVLVRLLGGDPRRGREAITEEELRDMVAVQPGLSAQERAVIAGAFELTDRTLREILVPRPQVLAFPSDLPATSAVQALVEGGHSRAPVYRDDLDDVVGIVNLRALVGAQGVVAGHAWPALVLPETVRAIDALRMLQAERQQMAVVISEHGGMEGIITIEDLVEELVGEIWDEADRDLKTVERHPDGTVTIPGSYPIHDLDDIGVSLPSGDYATVAGLVLDRLGRVPAVGEQLTAHGCRMTIMEATERSIERIRIEQIRSPGGISPNGPPAPGPMALPPRARPTPRST
jgi:putative hemolysin